MRKSFRALAAVLFAGLAAASCDSAPQIAGPEAAPQFSVDNTTSWRIVTPSTNGSGQSSVVIGRFSSATMSVGNSLGTHTLKVSSGTVATNTKFTMRFTGSGYRVDMSAVEYRNESNDVGKSGFIKPVELCYQYKAMPSGSTKLAVAELLPNGTIRLVPSAMASSKVCGLLNHFSEYVMVSD